ncbi:hypothetical protein ATANTOWER_025097 [Ataeniobius toweri]|uniref:Secreted protein n=1 Tax=Ataeniobius toweri TaxID=208326 RepID=A0ABU7ABL3_9TELE|nr:hypothetical protein [Ataeniobius toweri]
MLGSRLIRSSNAASHCSVLVSLWNCLSSVFLASRRGTNCGLLLLWPEVPQSFTCCALRDSILPMLAVKTSYFRYYHLEPVCPFSCNINKTFTSSQMPLTGYLTFLDHCSLNLRKGKG